MTREEITTATEMLTGRCDRIETCGDDSEGGLCLTAHWIDGGQKLFHTLGEVEYNCHEHAIRQLADEHEQDCYEDEGEAAYGRED